MDDDGELPEGDNRSRKKQKKTKKHKKIRKDEEQLKREAELALLTIDENLDTAALKHKTAEEEETTTKTKSRRARKDRAKVHCTSSLIRSAPPVTPRIRAGRS